MQMPNWAIALFVVLGSGIWIWFGALAAYVNFRMLNDNGPGGMMVAAILTVMGPFGLLFAATGLVEQSVTWRRSQAKRLALRMRYLRKGLNAQTAATDVKRRNSWTDACEGAANLLQDDRLQLAPAVKRTVPQTADG